ncbi:hypothetical protein BH10BAC4_BH10BAC4_14780 [soil metagenome]
MRQSAIRPILVKTQVIIVTSGVFAVSNDGNRSENKHAESAGML